LNSRSADRTNPGILKGYYTFENGKFVPHGDMQLINDMLKAMKMLAGSNESGKGEFYFDPRDNSFWHYIQHEDYRSEMRRVSREFITAQFPTVDCDKLLDIPARNRK
jgi:hypothetical protein